jgi:hypothetical protein
MTRLAPTLTLVVLATLPRPLLAAGKAAVLPATGEGVDSITLEIVATTLTDKLPDVGYEPVPIETVAQAAAQKCTSAGCMDPKDAIAVGKAVGADQVITVHLVKEGEEVVVRMLAYDVEASTNEQAAAKTAPSGVLSKVVKLLSIVLPDTAPAEPVEPPAPEPEPPPGPAPLPPGGAQSVEEGPEPISPGGGEQEEEEQEVKKDQSGRLELSISATMYAMMMTFTIMYAAEVKEWYWYPPAILLSGGAALAASLLITWKLKVTSGDAAMFDTCLGMGMSNGLLIPLAAGYLDPKAILVGTIIGGGVGLAGGILAAALFDPSRGDAALVSTFANWGSMLSLGLAWLAMPDLPGRLEHWMIAGVVGLDAGLVAGIVSAVFLEVSPKRLGFINLAGYLGGLLGATIGLPIVLVPKKKNLEDKHWKGYGAMVLSFSALGLVLGAVFTQKLDKPKKKGEKAGLSHMPFLMAHDESGWGFGVPSIAPVVGPQGMGSVTGAQIGIVGGVF